MQVRSKAAKLKTDALVRSRCQPLPTEALRDGYLLRQTPDAPSAAAVLSGTHCGTQSPAERALSTEPLRAWLAASPLVTGLVASRKQLRAIDSIARADRPGAPAVAARNVGDVMRNATVVLYTTSVSAFRSPIFALRALHAVVAAEDPIGIHRTLDGLQTRVVGPPKRVLPVGLEKIRL